MYSFNSNSVKEVINQTIINNISRKKQKKKKQESYLEMKQYRTQQV